MKYSVMRIERAKQQVLTGHQFVPVKGNKNHIMNWTQQDETALLAIIDELQAQCKQAGKQLSHAMLNRAIDSYQFSGGTHHANAGLSQCVFADDKHGQVHVRDPRKQAWMDTGSSW